MRRRYVAALLPLLFLAPLATPAGAVSTTPNDPLFAQSGSFPGQWGLRQIRAPEAWATAVGTGAVIAVVDTGVDLTHPDLAANVLPGRSFACAAARTPGSSPEGSCHDGGAWDPSTNPTAVPWHGTHVAGIAAAVAGNGQGVAGVAPGAKILPVDVFAGATAAASDVAAGIHWAVDNGADVVNLSLGPPVPTQVFELLPSDIADSIRYAHKKGVVVVAAAGNSAFPLCSSPAYIEGVLCVAATDQYGNPAEYSNLPFKGSSDVHTVRAPGGGTIHGWCGGMIVSTVPAGHGRTGCGYPADGAARPLYGDSNGTSMASPHVAGLAALLRSRGCNRLETVDLIEQTARDPGSAGGTGTWDPIYGWGIVDAAGAVGAARTACA